MTQLHDVVTDVRKYFEAYSKNTQSSEKKVKVFSLYCGLTLRSNRAATPKVSSYKSTSQQELDSIAHSVDISKPYAASIVKEGFKFLYKNEPTSFRVLKQRIAQLIEQECPMEASEFIRLLKKESLVPRHFDMKALSRLLSQLDAPSSINKIDKLYFVLASKQEQDYLESVKLKIDVEIKVKLAVKVRDLQTSLPKAQKSDIQWLLNLEQYYVSLNDGYYTLADYGEQYTSDFAFLFAKYFAVYDAIHKKDLLALLRRKYRSKIDTEHLNKTPSNTLIQALLSSGLLYNNGETFYGEGNTKKLSDVERAMVKLLAANAPQTGTKLRIDMEKQGFGMPAIANTKASSPLINQLDRNWYALFAHVKERLF